MLLGTSHNLAVQCRQVVVSPRIVLPLLRRSAYALPVSRPASVRSARVRPAQVCKPVLGVRVVPACFWALQPCFLASKKKTQA